MSVLGHEERELHRKDRKRDHNGQLHRDHDAKKKYNKQRKNFILQKT